MIMIFLNVQKFGQGCQLQIRDFIALRHVGKELNPHEILKGKKIDTYF
jgi:hypothetical protein